MGMAKKRITALSALALLALSGCLLLANVQAGTPPAEFEYNAEQIYALSADSVFYVRALRADGSVRATGTGVVLSPDGAAATAYHVVDDAERIEAVLADGRVVRGVKLAAFDEPSDAAILRLPSPASGSAGGKPAAYKPVPLREEPVRFGEAVFAIGYPLSATPIITEGIVNSPSAKINGRPRILASAPIVNGMSGGPLIDARGRLAGIMSGSLRTMSGIHLAIDAQTVALLLQTD